MGSIGFNDPKLYEKMQLQAEETREATLDRCILACLLLQDGENVSVDIFPERQQVSCTVASTDTLANLKSSLRRQDVGSPVNPQDAGSICFITSQENTKDAALYETIFAINTGATKSTFEVNVTTKAGAWPSAETIGSRFARVYQQLSKPDAVVRDVDCLVPQDWQQIFQWNDEELPLERSCIHQLVDAKAAEQPEAVAVSSSNIEITYKELKDSSDRLADRFTALGFGSGSYVPVCSEKSALVAVAMLAVLKAGGTLVMLDVNHPDERLKEIITSVDAQTILVSPDQKPRFSGTGIHAFEISSSNVEATSSISSPLDGEVSPDTAAFAVFSSGSTGKPKGILLSHEAICTSALSQAEAMGIESNTRALQFASYAFDVSIYEVFIPLIHGGCVCMPSEMERVTDLASFIRNQSIDWAVLTPSVAATISPAEVPGLKVLNLTGECPTQENVETWAREVKLVNAYGSSEASTCAPARLDPDSRPTYIGKLAGARGWIVHPEDSSKLVPPGHVGELLVEGHVVASGYLNDADKTKAAFLSPPSWLPSQAKRKPRLFKTGDLVKYAPDGSMYYLDRKDTQIRLRGHRVEPALIEAKIHQLRPGMASVVLDVSRPESGDSKMLAAFLMPRRDNFQDYEAGEDLILLPGDKARGHLFDLRASLEKVLAPYMVPSAFILVSSIPTTLNKKTDLKRLRSLATSMSTEQYAASTLEDPSRVAKSDNLTSQEQEMLRLWSLALRRNLSGVRNSTSFQSVGGDSIGAIKLASIARKDGSPGLDYFSILKNPTLGGMAALLQPGKLDNEEGQTYEAFSLLKTQSPKDIPGLVLGEEDTVVDAYPCIPLQEGMLALSMKQEGTYLAQNVFQLAPDVDEQRFRSAWESIVHGTDSLRLRFTILPSGDFVQAVVDAPVTWNHCSDDLESFLAADRGHHFKLGDRSSRFALVTESLGQRYFVWTCHHTTYDAWSTELLLQRLVATYNGKRLEPTVPYSQLVRHVCGADKQAAADFWQANLNGVEAVPFPVTLTEQSHDVSNEHEATFELPFTPDMTSGITAACMIQAAWALVLAQHTSSNDVVFGQISSGRNISLQGAEDIVGLVSTTVPVRVQVDRSMTVMQLLRSIQHTMLGIAEHQHYGLQNIRKSSKDAESACDFRNMLIVDPYEEEDELKRMETEKVLSKVSEGEATSRAYPLHLRCSLSPDKVAVQVRYDADIIGDKHTERLIRQFHHVLKQVGSLEIDVADVEIISPEDKAQILEWNSDQPSASQTLVHDTISRWARDTPDALAVDGHDGNFTFQQLEQQSSNLAKYLQSLGCAGQAIPLCFEKSVWTIPALLGVLKAGGSFVPMDPSHPTERLLEICAQCEAKVVLVSPGQLERLRGSAENVISWGADSAMPAPSEGGSQQDLAPVPMDADAYTIFTSGTTGKPKGVAIAHSALSSSVGWQGEMMMMSSKTRALEFASYAFDAMVLETIMILVHGGCICVPSDEDRMQLQDFITSKEINWAALNPSVARTLSPQKVPCLKTLIVGGEPLSHDLAELWASDVNLLNMCGPTETTVFCSGIQVDPQSPDPRCIGKCQNSRAWIVDPDDISRLMPLGSIGELVVEGPILSRGYVGDEEKSRAVFVPHPNWLGPPWQAGAQVYRTGDLCSYRDDGALLIWGRKDLQIKIRGNRIELPEISSRIKKALGRDAFVAVEAIKETSGAQYLAAFVCDTEQLAGSQDFDNVVSSDKQDFSQVQMSLKTAMPEYMIPSLWVQLKAVPVTTSNKVDKRTLQVIAKQRRAAQEETHDDISHEPLSEAEERLAEKWARLLSIDKGRIAPSSNFLAMGADSIGAMKLSAFCREDGKQLLVKDIFRSPTLSEMARKVTNLETNTISQDASPINQSIKEVARQYTIDESTIRDAYPCSPLQSALLTLSMQQPGSYIFKAVFNIPEEVDLASFKRAWEQVHRHHDILRTTYVPHEDVQYLQLVRECVIEWEELDTAPSDTYDLPMDPGSSMVRCELFDRTFGFSIHHSSYDGITLPRILRDVEKVYSGQQLGPSVSMKPFIEYLQSQDAKSADNFWASQLSEFSSSHFPPLPSKEHTPRADQVYEQTISFTRPDKTTITPATMVRTAWAALLAQYTGSEDVVLGVMVNGRNLVEVPGIEDLMGPTIATLPVRAQLSKSEKIQTLLERMQDQAVDMSTFEHTGIARIRRSCEGAIAACDFQTVLSVISHKDDEEEPMRIFTPENMVGQQTNFHTNGLTIECTLGEGSMHVKTYFDSAMVEAKQMKRMVAQLECGLAQMSSHEEAATVGSIDWVSDSDMKELSFWNSTKLQREELCVHTMIEDTVAQTPDAEAVCAWDGTATYAELDKMATTLAGHTVSLIKPGDYVLVCFEKSLWAIVSMLAVLKAGGTYVPLDRSYPRTRCEQIVEDTLAPLTLCSLSAIDLCKDLTSNVLTIEAESELLEGNKTHGKLPEVDPSQPCFALFTSGSTGRPKGIMIEHAGFCFGAKHHTKALNISSTSRVFQFAAFVFDVSFSDIFATLIKGGCICLPSDADRINDLPGAIRKLQATQIFLTPTVAKTFSPSEVPELKQLVIGGEAPTRDVLRLWGDALNLIVVWGPAETTVYASSSEYTRPHDNPACIGKPVGCNLWVTDADDPNRLAALGTVGEIIVEGPIAARGYINDKAKTEAAFITNPAWTRQDSPQEQTRRFYRTSDMGRFMPDGTIHFAGRRDAQVKIRGQRVELPEIEAQLRTFEGAEHIIVMVPSSGRLEKNLIALMTFHDLKAEFDDEVRVLSADNPSVKNAVAKIKEHVINRVPTYMVPNYLIPLQEFPRMVSGKLHRSQVKSWVESISADNVSAIEKLAGEEGQDLPQTDTEKKLRSIWSQVLGKPLETIGVNTPFFSLGGDSVSAIQVSGKARKEGLSITVQDVIKSKTICKLATLPNIQHSLESDTIAERQDRIPDGPFGLSPTQNALFAATRQKNMRFNQSFLLKTSRTLGRDELHAAMEKIVQAHPMLRARFSWHAEYERWMQEVSDAAKCEVVQEKNSVPSSRLSEVLEATHSVLDIQSGPQIAANLFQSSDTTGQLTPTVLLVCSHLVVDLVSWRIILEDLENLLQGREVDTQPESTSFPAWIEKRGKTTETLSGELASESVPQSYWGITDDLCYDDLVHRTFTIDKASADAIFGSSNQAFQTEPIELLLACLIQAFRDTFADRTLPPIHNESHGRHTFGQNIDTSRTIGWFTSRFPIQPDLSHPRSIQEAVRRTKDAIRSTPDAGKLGFDSEPVEILFNYSGRYQQLDSEDALLREMPLPQGICLEDFDVDKRIRPFALFDISVSAAAEGTMEWSFRYPRKCSKFDQIQSWFDRCQELLEFMPSYLNNRVPQPTLADFSNLQSYELLDQALNQVSRIASLDEIADIIPCTPLQAQMLKAHNVDDRLYIVSSVFGLELAAGKVFDRSRFEKAWKKVVARHDTLRTRFMSFSNVHNWKKTEHLQVVMQAVQPNIDWHYGDTNEAVATLEGLQSITVGHDEPTHKWDIFISPDGKAFGRLQICHALFDGVSTRILCEELSQFYSEDSSTSQPAPSFKGLSTYLSEQERQGDDSLKYWADHLSCAEPCQISQQQRLSLKDREAFHVKTIEVPCSSESVAYCQKHSIIPPAIFHMAWAKVLSEVTGKHDICFGYVSAGRDLPIENIDAAVGPYMNFLPCRIKLDGEACATEKLQQVQHDVFESLEHQTVPLNKICGTIGHDALFDTVVNFQGSTQQEDESTLGDLRLVPIDARDPMEWNVVLRVVKPDAETFVVTLEYWTTAVSHELAEKLEARLCQALSSLVS